MSEIQKNTNVQQCKQKENKNHLYFQEPSLGVQVTTKEVATRQGRTISQV